MYLVLRQTEETITVHVFVVYNKAIRCVQALHVARASRGDVGVYLGGSRTRAASFGNASSDGAASPAGESL